MPIRHPFGSPPVKGTAIEVAPGILWMRLLFPMRRALAACRWLKALQIVAALHAPDAGHGPRTNNFSDQRQPGSPR